MTEQEQDREILKLRQDLRDQEDALANTRTIIDSILAVLNVVAEEIAALKTERKLTIDEIKNSNTPEARLAWDRLQKGERT